MTVNAVPMASHLSTTWASCHRGPSNKAITSGATATVPAAIGNEIIQISDAILTYEGPRLRPARTSSAYLEYAALFIGDAISVIGTIEISPATANNPFAEVP